MRRIIVFLIIFLALAACGRQLPQTGEYTVEINGVDLWYKVAGQGNQVLLFQAPAQGTGADLFVQSMKPLEDDFTVVYYDSRGSGLSERNPDPETITIGQVVDDLEGLRAHLGLEEFALMGQSNGAFVALNYAQKYPDHLTHLILTNSGLGDSEEYSATMIGKMAMDEQYQEALMALGEFNATNDEEFTEWFKVVAPVYFRDVAACKAYVDTVAPDALDLETFLAIGATEHQFLGVYDNLAAIQIPTLVVAGEYDFGVSPESAEALAAALPDAELVVLKDTNHMPTMDNPDDLFAAVTDFLNSK